MVLHLKVLRGVALGCIVILNCGAEITRSTVHLLIETLHSFCFQNVPPRSDVTKSKGECIAGGPRIFLMY